MVAQRHLVEDVQDIHPSLSHAADKVTAHPVLGTTI